MFTIKSKMMSTEQTPNPPAFPINDSTLIAQMGLTMRDYFAAKAIQTPASYKPRNGYHWLRWLFGFYYKACSIRSNEIARNAYSVADAMLKARSELNSK